MREEAIVTRLYIKSVGQKVYFQIALPRDTKNIIGLEYGLMPDTGGPAPPPPPGIDPFFQILPSEHIGKLVLRTSGCGGGIIYQGDITKDSNIHFGDTISPVVWPPLNWTHGRKREEIEISVADNNWVEGFFSNEKEDDHYYLHLYLWIEKCA